ncbi:hypothetical protein Oscil6304_4159 [Oscillatoria acuminata PCC 6304]|uniref:Uncharacterized protein n=1 Tax=Oscillatoria acuminata PCC 6304 TaxID=56110 RepID=K9TMP9_9CYAN|nr:hypothetical protein Oscil6304_4159 [Oscillatoria acuminata PCC 6304]
MVLDALHQGPVTSSSYGCAIRASLFYTVVGKDEGSGLKTEEILGMEARLACRFL